MTRAHALPIGHAYAPETAHTAHTAHSRRPEQVCGDLEPRTDRARWAPEPRTPAGGHPRCARFPDAPCAVLSGLLAQFAAAPMRRDQQFQVPRARCARCARFRTDTNSQDSHVREGRLMTQRRDSPEDARKIAAHARQHLPCDDCGAAPGEPCTAPGNGRTVCKLRYIAAAVAIRRQEKIARRTPEQAAILAGLPQIPKAEIEKCRTPLGGYAFTRAWFLERGLPYPPVPGWRQAVEREDGNDAD